VNDEGAATTYTSFHTYKDDLYYPRYPPQSVTCPVCRQEKEKRAARLLGCCFCIIVDLDLDTVDFRKRVFQGIYFYNYVDNYFSGFVPAHTTCWYKPRKIIVKIIVNS
jgi:hypothetical protein